jgi:hypothetical protein
MLAAAKVSLHVSQNAKHVECKKLHECKNHVECNCNLYRKERTAYRKERKEMDCISSAKTKKNDSNF